MVRTLLDRAHLATPGQLPDVVQDAGDVLGWQTTLYLVDYDQRVLVPTRRDGHDDPPAQRVDGTLAGRCFRTVEPVVSPGGPEQLWLPVVDGVERLGVLDVRLPPGTDLGEPAVLQACRLLGHVTGHLIAAKRPYGDALDRLTRLRPLTVASELLHQILPPLTFACGGFVGSGLLEPAYDVAADAFDYSVVDDVAHLAVLDAT